MAVTVEQVNVLVTAEVDKALKELKKVEKAPKKVENQFINMAKSIAGPAAAGLMIKAFIDVSKQSSKLAASAEEVQNKFNVVFGETAKDVNEWAETYSDAVGRSETDTLKFLGTIGDTLKPLGFAKDAVDDMSKQVVELAGDLGSFNNIPTEEVIAGIQSALVGNVETLRRYGVVANETSIKQEALNSGLWDGEGALTAQEKAQAILQITMKGTEDAQGDLRNTQDSAANTQVRLESATKDLQIAYGNFVNEGLTPAKAALADFVAGMAEAITAQNTYKKFNEDIADGTIDNVDAIDDYITSLEAVAERSEGVRKTRIDAYLKELKDIREGLNTQEDTWLQKLGDDANRAANEAAGLQAELERQAGFQEDVAAAYAVFQESQLTAEEKEIANLQTQIDHWASLRSQMDDTTEVQKLINGLIAQRNELQKEDVVATQDQITWDEIQADIQLRNLLKVAEERARATESEVEQAEEVAQAWDSAYSDITNSAMNFFSAIDALATAQGSAELERLRAQGASEEELEQKKKEIARDEAKRKKALGLLNVGIDTASAIIGFLADPGGIPGIALSALAGVTGAVQAAAIAATPLPALAEGGSFTTSGPTPLLVGDNVGGQERVTVEPVSSNGANVRDRMPSGPITLVVDGKPFTAHFQRQIDNRNIRSSKGGAI